MDQGKRRIALGLLFFLAVGGCKEDPDTPPRTGKPEAPASPDPLSQKIEAFTGGHSRLVWSRHPDVGRSDTLANYTRLQLMGIDTADNRGIRAILEEKANYARPLITPNGESIVFTDKNTDRKKGSDKKTFQPVVYRVDWEGEHIEKLAEGFAVDVWRDPETSIDWVYVADLLPTDRSSMYARKLERFKLYDPEDREPVWDKTRLSVDNIQFSADGLRASALFPWPDAGVFNPAAGTHKKYSHGCWPSLSPDNSYVSWVFDGAHKNLFLFTDQANKSWTVPINTALGVGGHEVYHPRWSNHFQFITITGPYDGKTVVRTSGEKINVYIGRFDQRFSGIEDWLQVTDDNLGDCYPDLWIENAARAVPDPALFAQAPAAEDAGSAKVPERPWPVTQSPLLFLWEDRDSENLAEEGRESSVTARERARYGPHFEMLCDGGFFEADADSAEAVRKHFAKPGNSFTIEALATPFEADQDGVILSNESFQLKQRGGDFVFKSVKPAPAELWIGHVEPGKPTGIAILFDGVEFSAMRNGFPVPQRDRKEIPEMLASRRGLTFGSGWSGALEAVAISPGRLADSQIEKGREYLKKKVAARVGIPRIRLQAKLTAITGNRPVEALDTYKRALLGYVYEVEKVIEGPYAEPRVLVMHWTILDRTPVSGFPREIGKSYELLLEPASFHPELSSERQWNDVFEPFEPYYDISTPSE